MVLLLKKFEKTNFKVFLFLHNFAWFFTFSQIILHGIACRKLSWQSYELVLVTTILIDCPNNVQKRESLKKNVAESLLLFLIFENFTKFSYSFHYHKYIYSIRNVTCELHHQFPNVLRLRIFGNKVILEKSQNWIWTQPSVQFHLEK